MLHPPPVREPTSHPLREAALVDRFDCEAEAHVAGKGRSCERHQRSRPPNAYVRGMVALNMTKLRPFPVVVQILTRILEHFSGAGQEEPAYDQGFRLWRDGDIAWRHRRGRGRLPLNHLIVAGVLLWRGAYPTILLAAPREQNGDESHHMIPNSRRRTSSPMGDWYWWWSKCCSSFTSSARGVVPALAARAAAAPAACPMRKTIQRALITGG